VVHQPALSPVMPAGRRFIQHCACPAQAVSCYAASCCYHLLPPCFAQSCLAAVGSHCCMHNSAALLPPCRSSMRSRRPPPLKLTATWTTHTGMAHTRPASSPLLGTTSEPHLPPPGLPQLASQHWARCATAAACCWCRAVGYCSCQLFATQPRPQACSPITVPRFCLPAHELQAGSSRRGHECTAAGVPLHLGRRLWLNQ
jgi:hypothetical protein